MHIIEDSNQKVEKHKIKHENFDAAGDTLWRCRLPFGDYCAYPSVSIDTKENMNEICGNICGTTEEHKRFQTECVKAQEAGSQLIILVENRDGITSIDGVHYWINPDAVFRPRCAQGPRLEKAMRTMQERYGVLFMFCTPEQSADKIKELLTEYGNGRKKSEESGS